MEKDIDEVGKIARNVKARLEAINKDVTLCSFLLFKCLNFQALEHWNLFADFLPLSPELSQSAETWMWERNKYWQIQDECYKVCCKCLVLGPFHLSRRRGKKRSKLIFMIFIFFIFFAVLWQQNSRTWWWNFRYIYTSWLAYF